LVETKRRLINLRDPLGALHSCSDAAILGDLHQLERLGVNTARFETFEYASTQAIAAAVHFLEFDALIVPSARYDVQNLVVFLDRLQTPPELINTDSVNWTAWRARMRR
jgi:hypothetical protein